MKQHIEAAKNDLRDLHGLAGETEAAERRILDRAEARLDEVNGQIERQRPGIEGAPDASQDRYLALVQERGQLHVVIAKARAALGL